MKPGSFTQEPSSTLPKNTSSNPSLRTMTKDSDPSETKVRFTTSDKPPTLSGLQRESKIGLLLPGHSYGQEVEDKEASSTQNSRNLLLCQFGSGAATH